LTGVAAPFLSQYLMESTSASLAPSIKMAVKIKKRIPRPASKKYQREEPITYRQLSIHQRTILENVSRSVHLFSAKRWLILPSLHLGVERYIFLMNLHSITGILRQIRADGARIKMCPPAPSLFITPYDITGPMLKQARNIAIVNNKVRNRFKILARRWKTRNLKRANTEDLLTGEEPKQCICLRDYRNRSEYVFEADTIHKDMYERLLQSYLTFPEPALPRNPYTNELLTFSQFFNVMKQLYQVPAKRVHWALDALFSCCYDLTRFQNIMASKLRQSLIQRIMSTPTNETGIEVLSDFVEDCLEQTILITSEQLLQKRIAMYKWAVRNLTEHPTVCRWRVACYKHQLQRINAIPPTLKQKDELNREIAQLIMQTPQTDLQEAYDSAHPPPPPVAVALNDQDPYAWEEDFGLNHIYIIDIILNDATFI
jgi:hypothetical protein